MKNKFKNLPIVIFCGGKGTRLGSLTKKTPKPMIRVNKYPLVVNIIINYYKYGFRNFYLLTGYKHKSFTYYFEKFSNDIEKTKNIEIYKNCFRKNININLINTGINTSKKNRLLKVKNILENYENFMLTYGDGIANINFSKLYKFHITHKKIGTITAVHPPSRFGELKFSNLILKQLTEKPLMSEGFINGGFFVFNKKIFKYFTKNKKDFEHQVINDLCKKKQILVNFYYKQWICVDNERELKYLKKNIKKL